MKEFFKKNQQQGLFLLFACLISIVILAVCSKNSPLYPFNDWVDENAFFTVGKGWGQGLIPYRDLFEQKGPLLYFIFMIGSFFSATNFHGIFLLEILAMTVFAYYSGKLSDLFLPERGKYLIVPIFVSMICASPCFVHGGSAEEFCLPLLMLSLYHFVKFVTAKKPTISYLTLFLNGLLAGMIAMIKFNLLGFHFIFMAVIFFMLLFQKHYSRAFLSCLVFVGGMLIIPGLFLIYFNSVGTLNEFINVYFLYNTTGYLTVGKITIIERLGKILLMVLGYLYHNPYLLLFIPFAYLALYFDPLKMYSKRLRLGVLLLSLCLLIGICYGLVGYTYYILPLTIFTIFALLPLGYFLQANKTLSSFSMGGCLLVAATILMTSPNLTFMAKKKEDLVQYQFSNIIKQHKEPTLLNYGFLDGGFYLASDIVPNVRYFEMQNGSRKAKQKIYQHQIKYLNEKRTNFVVLRHPPNHRRLPEALRKNYRLVKTITQSYENKEFIYQLFIVKEEEK